MGKLVTVKVSKDSIPTQKHGKVNKKKKEYKKLIKNEQDEIVKSAVKDLSKKTNFENVESHNSSVKSKKKNKKNKKTLNKFKNIQDNEISSTTQSLDNIQSSEAYVKSKDSIDNKKKGVGLGELWMKYKQRSTLLIKAQSDWQSQLMDENPNVAPTASETKNKLKDLGKRILENDIENYMKVEASGSKKSEVQFRKTVFTHGTSRDKIAAHVLRCMEAPIHSLRNLNVLVSNVTPKSKDWMEAMDSVRDLLQTSLLPEGYVAREFEGHSFNSLLPLLVVSREQAEQQLGLWYYEDQLRKAYRTLILQLKLVCSDSIEQNKSRGIRCLLNLLSNHPKQEAETILEALVNKLGDPNRKVASNTMYGLRTLLQRRPQLKVQVVNLVEILLYRTNMKEKAKYYCLCFLKDLIFGKDDNKLAEKLIKLYFGFFKACTKQGEVDTRLMGALLRGINRAFPYTRIQGKDLEEQLNTLYKICHIVNFNIATQALQLIYQVIGGGDNASDRFYSVLYRQLQDPAFGVSSGTPAFLNLMFKALVKDESLQRIRAFIKRLLQVCQYQSSHLICGILYLISEVVKEKPQLGSVKEAMLKAGLQEEDDEEEFYPDLDCDDDEEQDEPKVKTKTISQKDEALPGSEKDGNDSDHDDDESSNEDEDDMESNSESEDESKNLKKVEDKKECDAALPENPVSKLVASLPKGSSWVHRSHIGGSTEAQSQYDPYHRNPIYCGAEYSPLWELQQLNDHFHPSVIKFACNLLSGESIDYTGDPLQDFTTMRFLDRFVYRNPKKITEQRDSAGGNVLGRRSQYAPSGVRGLQVNSAQFCNLDEKQIPEDDLFFHRYFKTYRIEKKKTDDASDTSSVEDDDFDGYLERMGGLGSDDEDVDDDLDFAASAQLTGDDGESDGSNDSDIEDLPGSDEENDMYGGSDEDPEPGDGDDDDDDDDNDNDLGLDGDDEDGPDFDGDVDSDPDKWQKLGELDSDDEELDKPKSKKQKKENSIKKKETSKESNKKENKNKNKTLKKKGKKDDSDSESDGESEMEFDEDIAFSDSDDDFGSAGKKGKQSKKANKNMMKSKRKSHSGTHGVFADAEEFAHLLEDNAEGGSQGITSNALSNADNAHRKQMTWEVKRDEQMRGVNWRGMKRKQGGHSRGGGRGDGGGSRGRGRGGGGSRGRGRGGRH